MPPDVTFTRSTLLKAAFATAFLVGILGLGLFAVVQGIIHREIVYFAEAFGALLLAGVGLPPMTGFWLLYFKSKP